MAFHLSMADQIKPCRLHGSLSADGQHQQQGNDLGDLGASTEHITGHPAETCSRPPAWQRAAM